MASQPLASESLGSERAPPLPDQPAHLPASADESDEAKPSRRGGAVASPRRGADKQKPPAPPAPLLGVDEHDPAERDPVVRGVLSFLRRTRTWPQRVAKGVGRAFHTRELDPEALKALPDAQRGQAAYFHVRDLCIDWTIQNMDSVNAVRMLAFAEECASKEIREAAIRIMLKSFEGASYERGSLASLKFRTLLRLVGSGELLAKSEEVVVRAVVQWLDTVHGDNLRTMLEERDALVDLMDRSAETMPGLSKATETLDGDEDRLRQEVDEQAGRAAAARGCLTSRREEMERLDTALIENDRIMLLAARELSAYKAEDLLVALYRDPPPKLQRILEGVAILFGTDEKTWSSTRRMCFEGHLVQLMLRYDFKAVLPADVKDVFEITSQHSLKPGVFKTNSANAIARWVHAASSCIRDTRLLIEADTLERGEKDALAREEGTLAALEHDFAAMQDAVGAHLSKLAGLEATLRMAKIHKELLFECLHRDAIRMEREVALLFKHIRWEMVNKDFFEAEVLGHPFVYSFVKPNQELAKVLDEILNHTPHSNFLSGCGSGTSQQVFSRRGVTAAGTVTQARIISMQGGLGGDGPPGSRLGWTRSVIFTPPPQPASSTLRGTSTMRGTSVLGGTVSPIGHSTTAIPAAVGNTSKGALVCVSMGYIVVCGGIDRSGRASAQVVKAPVGPPHEHLQRKEWEHVAFMATPRAFACGGIVPARVPRSGIIPESNSDCLIVCGGHDANGDYLASVEASQAPHLDHFTDLPPLSIPRTLSTLALVPDSSGGAPYVVLMAGYDAYGNPVEDVDILPNRILFDIFGALTVKDSEI